MQPSQQYSWKNLRSDIYRHLLAFILNVQFTSLIAALKTLRSMRPYKTLLGWTTAFTFTLILDQTILTTSSTQFASWYQGAVVSTFFLTISLWSFLALEAITNGGLSTIFQRGLRCLSKNSTSPSSSSATSTTTASPEDRETSQKSPTSE